MRPSNAIPDAPVYKASLDDMTDLSELIAGVAHMAVRYGAVRIDPPQDWQRPPLRMTPSSRFFVRMQTLPAAPFVHFTPASSPHPHPSSHTEAVKRKRRKLSRSFVEVVEEVEEGKAEKEDPPCEDVERVRAAGHQLRRSVGDVGVPNVDAACSVVGREEVTMTRNCEKDDGAKVMRVSENGANGATPIGSSEQGRIIRVPNGGNMLAEGAAAHNDAFLSKQPVLLHGAAQLASLPNQCNTCRRDEMNVSDGVDHAQMGEKNSGTILRNATCEREGAHNVYNARENILVQTPASAAGQAMGPLNAQSRGTPDFVHLASAPRKLSMSCEDLQDRKLVRQGHESAGSEVTLTKPLMLRSQPLANVGDRQTFPASSAAIVAATSVEGIQRQSSVFAAALPGSHVQDPGFSVEKKQQQRKDGEKCADEACRGAITSMHSAKIPQHAITNVLVQQRDRDETGRCRGGQAAVLPSVVTPSQSATLRGKFRIPRSVPIPSSLVPAPPAETRDSLRTKPAGTPVEQSIPPPKIQCLQNSLPTCADEYLEDSIKSSGKTSPPQQKEEPSHRTSNGIGLLLNPMEDLSPPQQNPSKAKDVSASTSLIGNSFKAVNNYSHVWLPDHIPDVAVSQRPRFVLPSAGSKGDVQVQNGYKQGQNLNQVSIAPRNVPRQNCPPGLRDLKDRGRTSESVIEPNYPSTAVFDGCKPMPEVSGQLKSLGAVEAHSLVDEIPNHIKGRNNAISSQPSVIPLPATTGAALAGSHQELNLSDPVIARGDNSRTEQHVSASLAYGGDKQLCERVSRSDLCTVDIETELTRSTQYAAKDIRAIERSGQIAERIVDSEERRSGTVGLVVSQNLHTSTATSVQNAQECMQNSLSVLQTALPATLSSGDPNRAPKVITANDENNNSTKEFEKANLNAPNSSISSASLAEGMALSSNKTHLASVSHAADLPGYVENAKGEEDRLVAETAPQPSNPQMLGMPEHIQGDQTLAAEPTKMVKTKGGYDQGDHEFKSTLPEPLNLRSTAAGESKADEYLANDTTGNNEEVRGSNLLLKLRVKDAVTKESALNLGSEGETPDLLHNSEPAQFGPKDSPAATGRNRANTNYSTEHAKLGNEQASKRRGNTKQPNKRKVNHVSHMRWDQDKAGRLTKPIVFPDSSHPVTLNNYKTKALSFEGEVWDFLRGDKSINVASLTEIAGEGDWRRSPDALEELFWNALERGIDNKALTVPYGVDVEVEGAFDSTGMSYVEWYGVEDIHSAAKKDRRKNTGKRKLKGEPQVSNAANSCSKHSTTNPTCDRQASNLQLSHGNSVKSSGGHRVEEKQTESEQKPFLFAGPYSHVGNLNTKGLLRHMPRMPGINHSMYYIGQLFSRFCWHTEDAFLNSVSYLHRGSAEKIWYAVPPKFATQFEDYATESVFSDNLLDEYGTGQALLMNKTTMFDPRKLRSQGIQVYRVVHKPGSFVLTAARAYHAGFNCGFNIAEAVNFANPTWFPVGREASRFARQIAKPLCVPWEYLLFHEAKAIRDGSTISKRPRKTDRLSQSAAILANELEMVITRGERCIRAYAEKTNCRLAMIGDVDVLVQKNQLGPEFGHGAGMICSICGHTCHFYSEICGSCDDSFEARCVEHFGEGHRLCLIPEHKTMLVRRHDPVIVADILRALEELAGIQRTPSEVLERYTGYLRPWETPMKRSGLRLKLNFKLAASRLPPVLAGGGSKYSRHGSQKERGSGRKRMERPTVVKEEESDREIEAARTVKRRRSGKQRPEPNRRRKTGEPLVTESNSTVKIMSEEAILPPRGSEDLRKKVDLEGIRALKRKIRREPLSSDYISDMDCVMVKGTRQK